MNNAGLKFSIKFDGSKKIIVRDRSVCEYLAEIGAKLICVSPVGGEAEINGARVHFALVIPRR